MSSGVPPDPEGPSRSQMPPPCSPRVTSKCRLVPGMRDTAVIRLAAESDHQMVRFWNSYAEGQDFRSGNQIEIRGLALSLNAFRRRIRGRSARIRTVADGLIGDDRSLAAWLNSLPPRHREHVLSVTGNSPDWWRKELSGTDAERTRASLASGFWLLDVAAERDRLRGSGLSVSESMRVVIDLCSRLRPHPDWPRFEGLDYEDDVRRLAVWLADTFRASEPNAGVTGLWFGMFNPVDDGQPTADIYVAGGEARFDDPEWIYELAWQPSGRAGSTVLDSIYRISYPPGLVTSQSAEAEKSAYQAEGATRLGNDAEYTLCLSYAVFAIEWLAESDTNWPTTSDEVDRTIVVGFDAGDFLELGSRSARGFTRARVVR
jgi:hypothetical protein